MDVYPKYYAGKNTILLLMAKSYPFPIFSIFEIYSSDKRLLSCPTVQKIEINFFNVGCRIFEFLVSRHSL